jgi:hypothetical protein
MIKNIILILTFLFICTGCEVGSAFVVAWNTDWEEECCIPSAINCGQGTDIAGVQFSCGIYRNPITYETTDICDLSIEEYDSLGLSTQFIDGCIYEE